ncbi:hypothetical protein [Nocardia cyriacigeorgica]|uniref:hypothetical protein n=1 Tax=Nocardia cyriacigeorgica TaxID=135487 RepID=UPI0018940A9A|nr:hypothetical protein [Nocardia cyriacigeorgica]MBF6435379.1 hypothetical protein [Nocardia cyriacigeorgica]
MTLAMLLDELHRGEHTLEHDLTALSARHRAEHEIRYIAGDLAAWSREHRKRIERVCPHHGAGAHHALSLRSVTAPLQRRVSDLLELAQDCHPQTLRQLRWANAMLKVLSPQILAG